MQKAEIGVIGLAVMGSNLARNLASKNIRTVVYNRTTSKIDEFMQNYAQKGTLQAAYSLKELAEKLERPRRVILLVKAGAPVDSMLEQLAEVFEPGDIVIDGGNSFFEDTRRRAVRCQELGLEFVGMGVSGGEEGALHGPSLMPGCSQATYTYLEHSLKAIAAKAGENHDEPCVDYIGTDGAGHYVKMVHNGIEYADMQMIADTYSIMKKVLGMDNKAIAEIFASWNQGELSSYLIEITATVLQKQDELTDKDLVDVVLDVAKQKGTGKWVSLNALDLGVAIPTITEAVFARLLSERKPERVSLAQVYADIPVAAAPISPEEKTELLEALRKALYAAKICAYAQGFNLIAAASKKYDWHLNLASLAKIWRNGCIIRAAFLDAVSAGFTQEPELTNLLFCKVFENALQTARAGWGKVVGLAAMAGVPVIALSSALSYFDVYRTACGNANILQAQRDCFGAHTYERTDREGTFHSDWLN